MRIVPAIGLAMALCAPIAARAQSAEAKRFGARESVEQISLSPDGTRVAIITPMPGGAGSALLVSDAQTGKLNPLTRSTGTPERLSHCTWAGNTRLACQVFIIDATGGDLLPLTRMFAIDADGGNLRELSPRANARALSVAQFGGSVIDWLPDETGSAVLMHRAHVPEATTGNLTARTREGLGVDRVDTVTLKRTPVEPPRASATEFITDGHGKARILVQEPRTSSGYVGSRVLTFFRTPDDREWKPLSTATANSQTISGFQPAAVDRDLNLVYGFENIEGRTALVSIALDGSMKRDIVFKRDDVDVDGLVRIGRQRRVVGVSFATDKREVAFFDPKLKALGASLSKAIPGLPLVSFVDASADESKLLLFAGSDVDPGRYFLLDRTTRKMAEVLPARGELAGTKLAPVKSISFTAADGTKIPGYLTLPVDSDGKNLPAIVLPHGGPSARDEWGFDWLSQFYAARGYAVLQPNFRGSSGYGEGWFQDNGFKSWKTAIGDVNDGARWLVQQGIAAPGKLAIVGWSYGGYAALQSPVLDPDLFKAIVAVAPVTDLETLRKESEGWLSYSRVSAFIGTGPHVREGSPAQNVDRIKAPVLLFHGDRDLNVGVGESRLMASRLRGAGKKVEFVEFEGLDHQLEDDRARVALLDRSDQFIRTALGLPAKP